MPAWGAPRVGINNSGAVYETIQDAVNAAVSGDTIQVSAGTYNENVAISDKALTISGDYCSDCITTGCGVAVANGGGSNYVFQITGNTVTLQRFQITGGQNANGGGIRVLSGANVTLNNTNIFENSGNNGGGAYISPDAQLTLNQSSIYNNTATATGGGVRVWGTLTANDTQSDIYGNTAPHGGGLSVPGGTVNLTGADLYGNQASDAVGKGGAIHIYDGGVLTLTGTVWIYNRNRAYDGAGIYAENSTITGNGSNMVFQGNTASNNGGAIYLGDGNAFTLNNIQIGGAANQAINGGGIYVNGSSTVLDLTAITITGNNATSYGGAIYVVSGDINLLDDNIIDTNQAGIDGGGIYQTGGTVDFKGSWSIENNSASGNGGALVITGTGNASLRAEGETNYLTNNYASGHGGAVYLNNNSSLELYATEGYDLNVFDNHAGGNGGAFYADNGGFFDGYGQLFIDGNNANGNGGAYYLSNGSRVWFDDYQNTLPKVLSNWAQNGGAVYATDSPKVDCDGAEFGDASLGNYATNGSGGAIFLNNSTLDADNCKFYNNKATLNGGAIAASGASSVKIYATLSSYFSETIIAASLHKSNAYILSFNPPVIPMSTAVNPHIGESSSLHNNIADSDNNNSGYGGATYTNDSTLELKQTYLHHNSAYQGGAIYQTGVSASADVSNCLIHHNTVGVALGAGIRRSNGAFTITHTIIADNEGGSGFSGTATSATNNIAWGNSLAGFSTAPASYSCNIDDGGVAGINSDPLFISPGDGGNYHLQEGSPAINACDTGALTDLKNRPRPNGTKYDMGAYEYFLEYDVAAVANPVVGGTVSGAGTYVNNSPVTVKATASTGYVFLHWTNGGTVVSNNSSYSFSATADVNLQANFSQVQSEYFISASARNTNHGTITGEGTYSHDASVTLTATPKTGFSFSHWIETWDGFQGSFIVSTEESYTFTANRERKLTAVFRPKVLPGVLMLLLEDE
ncbi:MAG: hypothetical protein JW927_05590 [Deltaproteobacteria bacterium]|nr:hypothetical protein [Deltaproteobacteria bacterium]